MKYKNQVYIKPNVNIHHPQGGWLTTGTFNTKEKAQHIHDIATNISDRVSKPRVAHRILVVDDTRIS